MYVILLLGLIVIVFTLGAVRSEKDSSESATCFLGACLFMVLIMVIACTTIYNRGRPVILANMPYSMNHGTVYKVLGLANEYAIVTDNARTSWTMSGNTDNNLKLDNLKENTVLSVWLVKLIQTNVVVGNSYMVRSQQDAKDEPRRETFVEVQSELK